MTTVDVHEAKAHFATLLNRVAAGEEIIITRDGRPAARLVGMRPADQARVDAAFEMLKRLRKHTRLGRLSLNELRDVGRR